MFFSYSRRSFRYSILPLLAFMLFLAFASPTFADGGVTVNTSVTDAPNGAFAEEDAMILTLNLAGASDLHATEFILNFDPAEIQILDADAIQNGIQIEAGNCTSNDLNINLVENTTGVIRYAAMYLQAAPMNRSASCVIARIPFKLQTDVSYASIAFEDLILLNSREQLNTEVPDTVYLPSVPTAITLGDLEANHSANDLLWLAGMIGMTLMLAWRRRPA